MDWQVNVGVKTAIGIVGNITALGLFLVPMKTFIRVINRKSTEGFSVFPYSVTLFQCLLWTWYGSPAVAEGRTLVITINAIGSLLEAFYVLTFFIFAAPKKKVQTGLYTAVELIFLGVVILITVLAFHMSESRSLFTGVFASVVNVAMNVAPLEIMGLVIRTRSVEFMPFYLSLLVFINSAAWTTYAAYTRDIFILIPNALGLLFGAAQLVLYGWYHKIEKQEKGKSPILVQMDGGGEA